MEQPSIIKDRFSVYVKKLFYPGWWKYFLLGAVVTLLIIVALFNGVSYLASGRWYILQDHLDNEDIVILGCFVVFWMLCGGYAATRARMQYLVMASTRKAAIPTDEAAQEQRESAGKTFRKKVAADSWKMVAMFPLLMYAFNRTYPKSITAFIIIAIVELIAWWLYRYANRTEGKGREHHK